MDEATRTPREGERRGSDRRKQPGAAYAGPERRVGQRRSGNERRQQPRLYCPLPEDFE